MELSSKELLKNAAILATAIYLATSQVIDRFSPGDMDTTEAPDLDQILEDAQEAIESVKDVIEMSMKFARDLSHTISPVKQSSHEKFIEKIKARQSQVTKMSVEKVKPRSSITVSTQKYKTAVTEIKNEKDEKSEREVQPSNLL